MSYEYPELRTSANSMVRLLEFVRNCPYPDLAPAFAYGAAAQVFDNSRRMAYMCMEPLLQAEIARRDPGLLGRRFAAEAMSIESDYWTGNPISRGILDAAVDTGIITPFQRKSIQTGLPLTLARTDDITPILARIEADIALLQWAVKMAGDDGVEPAAQSEPVFTAAPSLEPEYNTQEVHAALEIRFRGTLERELKGTLGRILIFRNPPNTSPERIAVKTITPDNIKSRVPADALKRIAHEVKHWISYRHSPFILPPFFVAMIHGWPYVAMPYCENTLRQYIDKDVAPTDLPESLALMIQVACGLEFAYRKGLKAHQDLKPENILIQSLQARFTMPGHLPVQMAGSASGLWNGKRLFGTQCALG